MTWGGGGGGIWTGWVLPLQIVMTFGLALIAVALSCSVWLMQAGTVSNLAGISGHSRSGVTQWSFHFKLSVRCTVKRRINLAQEFYLRSRVGIGDAKWRGITALFNKNMGSAIFFKWAAAFQPVCDLEQPCHFSVVDSDVNKASVCGTHGPTFFGCKEQNREKFLWCIKIFLKTTIRSLAIEIFAYFVFWVQLTSLPLHFVEFFTWCSTFMW